MPRPKIRVRSKTNGLIAEISPDALRHFPDFELVDAAPDAVFVEPPLPPDAVEPSKTPRRSAAAKTNEEE